ncbi:MAG: putative salt-induced outer membrane protein YdiY [Lentimonas sp.]|jgi:putative salt-induced outer membrane protein YdiY
MYKKDMTRTLLCLAALLASLSPAIADVVITTDGAKLTGSISRIEAGVIYLDTAYAGTLEIKQALVSSFETEAPLFVRLVSGTTMAGPVASAADGKIKIISTDGTMETELSRVIASWGPQSEDPQIAGLKARELAMSRQWKFKGSLDMLGKSGNTEEFGLGARFDAKLKSPNDELAFFAELEQRETEGATTEDRIAGGISYESFFSEHYGWYVRERLETDKIDNIEFRATTGFGLSYRLINKEKQNLQLRSGLGHRYTGYDNGTENESSATLDFGLAHSYTYKNVFSMDNVLTYVPSVDDFGIYTIIHDSGIEFPVGSGQQWSIRMGVKNEYESQPAADKKLDTTYYSRMIYSWK